MNKASIGSEASIESRHVAGGALCLLALGLGMLAGCANQKVEEAELPPIKQSSSKPRPKVGSVKDGGPTLASLEASLAKLKSDSKMDPGKKAMGIGVLEGKIKEMKSKGQK